MASPIVQQNSSRLQSIQILRGVAASVVVFHHYSLTIQEYVGHSWIVQSGFGWLGRSGVDLFFTISGFIMVFTTLKMQGARGSVDFLNRRVRRIFPPYWIWTSAFLVLWFLGIGSKSHQYGIGYIIGSYLLFPVYSAQNGDFHPMLSVGWTLSFEMFFYLAFALVIAIGRPKLRVPLLAAIFAALAVAVLVLPEKNGLRYLASAPIIIEFLFGAAAAQITIALKGKSMGNQLLPKMLIVVGVLGLVASTQYSYPESLRFLVYGFPSFLIVLGAANWQNAPSHGALIYLGDASYSIYLTQWLLLLPFSRMAKNGASFGHLPSDLIIVVGSLVTIPVVSLTYLLVERPLLKVVSVKKKSSSSQLVPTT